MGNEKISVIGLGEIGRTLFEIFKKSNNFDVYGLDINETRMNAIEQKQSMIPPKIDILVFHLKIKKNLSKQLPFTQNSINQIC